MTCRVAIIAYEGCSAGVLMSAADVFSHANLLAQSLDPQMEKPFHVQLVTQDGASVRSSNGYPLPVNGDLSLIQPGDIALFHGTPLADEEQTRQALRRWPSLTSWLQANLPQLRLFACNYSGSQLLGEQGLWQASPPSIRQRLMDMFKDNSSSSVMGIQAENVLCVPLNTSFVDLCMSVVARFSGSNFARNVAREMAVDYSLSPADGFLSRNILGSSLVGNANSLVSRAEAWIQANLSREVKVEDVAQQMAVSTRTLIRHFQEQINQTPQGYIQQLRIEKCKLLLATTSLKFSQIVDRCGYSDESALRKLFKKTCQVSPSEYRRQFTDK